MSAAVMQQQQQPAWSNSMPASPTKRVTGFDMHQQQQNATIPRSAHDPTMSPPSLNDMSRSLSDSAVPRSAHRQPGNKASSPLSNAPVAAGFDHQLHLDHPPHSAVLPEPQHPKLPMHQHSHSWSASPFAGGVTAPHFQASPYQPSEVYTPPGSYHDGGGQLFHNYSVQPVGDAFYGSLPPPASIMTANRKPAAQQGLRPGPPMDRRNSSSGSTQSPENPALELSGAPPTAMFQPSSYHPMPMHDNSLFGGQDSLKPRSGAGMMAASAPPDFDLGMPPSISSAHRRSTRGKGHATIEESVHKQLDVATEKKRKRRESHNLVERRRRDGINLAIQQLSELLPEQMLEPIGTGQTTHHTHHKTDSTQSIGSVLSHSDSGPGTPSDFVGGTGSLSALRPNKSVVLQKAVDYLIYLKQVVDAQNARNQELESMISDLQRTNIQENDPSAFSFAHSQSTEALFEDDPMQTQ